MNSFSDVLKKIPWILLSAATVLYTAWSWYDFENSPDSPLIMKQNEFQTTQATTVKLQNKLQGMKKFVEELEVRKGELAALHQKFKNLRADLAENIDIPQFMKTTFTEAKKTGLDVTGLRPLGAKIKADFYQFQDFEFKFRGLYAQFVSFLDSMSKIRDVVRVDEYNLRTQSTTADQRYTFLDGTVKIRVYEYLPGDEAQAP